jgi:hypothetical protein
VFDGEFGRVCHGGTGPACLLADEAVDGDGGVGEAEEGHEDGGGVEGGGCVFVGFGGGRGRGGCRGCVSLGEGLTGEGFEWSMMEKAIWEELAG